MSVFIERKERIKFEFQGWPFEVDVREINSPSGMRTFEVAATVDDSYTFKTTFHQAGRTTPTVFYSTAYGTEHRPGVPRMWNIGQPSTINTAEKLFARFVRHIVKKLESR